MAGVEPRFHEWKGSGSPLQWVVSMAQRHLSSGQRAALALDSLRLLKKEVGSVIVFTGPLGQTIRF
jgi:hypothetical protein